MQKISISHLSNFLTGSLLACGLSSTDSATAADVVMRATLRGVGHHDVNDFPGRLKALIDGSIPVSPVYTPLAAFAGMESWDGGGALGELVCTYAMDRAMALADVHGMGLCAVRHSNHFLAAAPYVERACEKGYVAMLLCKGGPSMGAPGRTDKTIGALPMGFAFPTNEGYPVMLDACMAYASFGLLNEKIKAGKSIPAHWGLDSDGNPTEDPAAVANGTRMPIGGHKGFGLAILGEVLTSLLSQGCVVDEVDRINGQKAPTSHTAIAIKAGALLPEGEFTARTSEIVQRMEKRSPGLHVPGQGSHNARVAMEKAGCIELDKGLIEQLNELGARLGMAPASLL